MFPPGFVSYLLFLRQLLVDMGIKKQKTAGIIGRGFWKGENKKPQAWEAAHGFNLCYMIRLFMAGTPPSGSCATTSILR